MNKVNTIYCGSPDKIGRIRRKATMKGAWLNTSCVNNQEECHVLVHYPVSRINGAFRFFTVGKKHVSKSVPCVANARSRSMLKSCAPSFASARCWRRTKNSQEDSPLWKINMTPNSKPYSTPSDNLWPRNHRPNVTRSVSNAKTNNTLRPYPLSSDTYSSSSSLPPVITCPLFVRLFSVTL